MIEKSQDRIPAGAAGEFSSPRSTFCADSYFGIRSPPRVTTVARKKVQVAGYMHHTYMSLHEATWCMVV